MKYYRIPEIVNIYLMRVGNTNIYKIGHTSKDISERIRHIRFYIPNISLVHIKKTKVVYERLFHRLFEDRRINYNGFTEYFTLNSSDLRILDNFFK